MVLPLFGLIGICTIGSSSGSIEMERVDVQVPASAYPTIKRTLMDDLENHRKESNGLKYYIPVITGFIGKECKEE